MKVCRLWRCISPTRPHATSSASVPVISPVATGTITGMGFYGYKLAIEAVAHLWKNADIDIPSWIQPDACL